MTARLLLTRSRRRKPGKPLKLLLESAVDVNAADDANWTALLYEAKHGHLKRFNPCWKREAIPTIKMKKRQTALMLAASSGVYGNCRRVIAGGAKLEEKDKDGKTALLSAIQNGHSETAAVLIEKERMSRSGDHNGETALVLAVKARIRNCLNSMINKGLDLNQALQAAGKRRPLNH